MKPGELKWREVSQITGKRIIADCGYGVAGGASSNCNNWAIGNSLVDRMNDGVIALSQANRGLNTLSRPTLPARRN